MPVLRTADQRAVVRALSAPRGSAASSSPPERQHRAEMISPGTEITPIPPAASPTSPASSPGTNMQPSQVESSAVFLTSAGA
jgi:hypothetical protein